MTIFTKNRMAYLNGFNLGSLTVAAVFAFKFRDFIPVWLWVAVAGCLAVILLPAWKYGYLAGDVP